MKTIITIILCFAALVGNSQREVLKTDSSVAIPALQFDSNGDLIITASANSSPRDFDFLVGKWKMYHRRLNKRLVGNNEWTEFQSEDSNWQMLNNTADFDIYRTTEMPGLEGKLFEGVTLRLFDQKKRLWSLYWVASNTGTLNPPMVGSFENKIGHFFAKLDYNGKPVIGVFRWDIRNPERPIWSQAFTADRGKTWEWNWYNVSVRIN